MFCDKCGGKVNSNRKCSLCGYDNSIYNPENYAVKPKSIRSKRLTVCMCLVIMSNLFVANLMLMTLYTVNGMITTVQTVILVLTILLCVFEIILAFFILKLKAWALITYMVIGVIAIAIRLLRLDFDVAIAKAVLLYFIFDIDWEYFD